MGKEAGNGVLFKWELFYPPQHRPQTRLTHLGENLASPLTLVLSVCLLPSSPTIQACSFLKRSAPRDPCSRVFGMFGTPGLLSIWPPWSTRSYSLGYTASSREHHQGTLQTLLACRTQAEDSAFIWRSTASSHLASEKKKRERERKYILWDYPFKNKRHWEPWRCDSWIFFKKGRVLQLPGVQVADSLQLSASHDLPQFSHRGQGLTGQPQTMIRTTGTLGPGYFCPTYDSSMSCLCSLSRKWKDNPQNERKYLQILCLISGLSTEYIKSSYSAMVIKTNKQTNNPIKI